MTRLALLLLGLVVWADGQIYFPDQFDSLMQAYEKAQKNGMPNPTFFPAEGTGAFARPVYKDASQMYPNDNTFYPAMPQLGAAAYADDTPAQSQARDPETEYWSNHVSNILSNGITKFAIDMDSAIYQSLVQHQANDDSNVIFSPLSIASTLAMVLLGSAGVTFQEVSRILGLESGVDISSHSEIVHLMLGLVLKSIDAESDLSGPQITMANGMFLQNGFPIGNEFLAISRAAYNNEIINLDFLNQPEEAKKVINDWVKLRTRGKIASILDDPIDADTRLIIASALYFNGEWNRYFFPRTTRREPFAVTPEKSVMVDMMFNGGNFPFYQDRRLQVKIIGLPYKGWQKVDGAGEARPKAMMYVLLPTSTDGNALRRLETSLTPQSLEELISRMKNTTCIVGLPRMKISSNLNLNKALQSLGLVSLFDRRNSNLALLSPVFKNGTSMGSVPSVRTRFGGGDDDDDDKTASNDTRSSDDRRRNNIFRYEDKAGGYSVEQWDSGVYIEKIPRSFHRKRSTRQQPPRETGKSSRQVKSEKPVAYETGSPNESPKLVRLEENKYKFEQVRPKREGRAIDQDFVRFIESRHSFPDYGLDSLRHNPDLGNPGLFASDVLHKVEMEITETGTTAAAVTSSTFQRGGDIKRLVAERPFLFFIRHESSRLILFWGAINRPTPYY